MLDTIALWAISALVAIWLVYPATMMVLAGIRARPSHAHLAAPRVTVVIASREPADVVGRRIDNIFDTDYDTALLDVVVAVDAAAAAAGGHHALAGDRVRVLTGEAPGKAAALNTGIAVAEGDVLVFADSCQMYDRQTIPALVGALDDPSVGAATGVLHLPASRATIARAYWGYEKRLRAAEARVHSSIGATGAVYAMRRSLWTPLPAGLLLDDVYAPMAVVLGGHRVAVAEGALAFETRESTPGNEFRRKIRTLTGVLQLCAWLPGVVAPWRNPVWLQFVFHKLLRLLTPYLAAVVGVWLLVRAAEPLRGALPAAVAGIALLGIWIWRSRSRIGSRLRDMTVEAVLLQWAIVMAGINGVRGRWEVWNG
jgi:cellulose synthase/poly-beta-1,6-N-acetylglucosamine synthase-like glycosyltransferase